MCSYRLNDIANSITAATYDVIAQGKVKTPDLGGERTLSVSDLHSFILNLQIFALIKVMRPRVILLLL